MNKFTIVLAVILIILCSSYVYADENESTQEEITNEKLKENEKQVKEILDPNNKSMNLKQKVWKLTEIGEQAVPFLIDEINSGENVYVAAQALNKIMGKKCIPELFNAYVIRSKTNVGRYYLASEIRIHKKDSLKYLFEKMKDEDELVRMNAVELIAYCDRFNSIDELKVQYEKDESILVKLQIINEIYDVDNRSQSEYLSFVHKMIKSTSEDLRLKALDVTMKINDETQIDSIISFLDDKSFEVRKKAIKTLLHFEKEKTIEAVINTFKHEDAETTMKAVIYLGSHYYKNKEIEKTVIKALVEELSNEEKNMRMKVVMSLGGFSDLEIIPHLEKIAETDPDEIIRERAKLSIKLIQMKLKRKENLENSKKNKHNHGGPKDSEENELSPVEKQINEILNQELEDVDKIKKLVEIGEPATQYLLLMLYDEDKKIVFISASALKEIKEILCLPQLVDAYLIKKNDGLKKVILNFKKEAFPYLASKLDDNDEFVRVKIVSLIVLLRDERSDEVLENQFMKETSDRVKLHIAMFLKNSFTEPREEYLAFIYKMLESQDDELKCKALNILRTSKDFTQIALMIKLTRDNSKYVRSAALYAINEYECEDTVDAILEALNHEDEDTRNIAASCLLNHCFKDEELKKKSIKALINALDDEDYRVRCSVIRALSVRDDMSIIPHLDKIAQEDTIEKNREYAKQAIKQIKKRNGIVDKKNGNDEKSKMK